MGDKAEATLDVNLIPPIESTVDDASRSPSTFNPLLSPLVHNPIVYSIRSVYRGFNERRAALGLPNPGTVEDVSKEVSREVFLKNLMFSGFRAEFNKGFSSAPLFQTAHSLAMGGNGGLPPYSFAALYGSPKIFAQGNIDNDFQLSSRLNYRPFSALTLKNSLQLAPQSTGQPSQSMVQLEANYKGQDFSIDLKAMNPSVLDASNKFTGILVGSYLQSITPKLALGLETMWQRTAGDEPPSAMTSYAMRYKSDDWIASGTLMPAHGILQGAYWKRLSKSVEAGLDINMSLAGTLSGAAGSDAAAMGGMGPMMGALKNEGTATLGAKYDFRTSVFRGQVDTTGKVAAVLDKRIAPMIQFTFAGEMDHSKNAARLGIAVQVESAGSEEFMEAQEKIQQGEQEAKADVPPF